MTPAQKEASMLNYQGLQRGCIVRGMAFDQLVKGQFHTLQDFFIRNYHEPIDNSRLDAFDEWRKEVMLKRGLDEPFVRLGFIGVIDEQTGHVLSIKKPKKFKKPKVKQKREKDETFGIWKGTKKALTAQCVTEGKTLEKAINIVTAQFPDAQAKSISIWFKRFIKAQKAG
jgi:hypothetical protein